MNWWQAVLAYVIGPGIAVAGSVVVARLAGRSSDKAADNTADVTREANAIDGFDRLVKSLEKRVDEQQGQITGLSARVGDLDREVSRLRDERRENRALIRRLWGRLQVAVAEIKRLGGTPPPENIHDAERVALILEAEA